ncbi:hypothetical protein [Krasilnikovia sp. M28-CT-15]|uniref:hypothetical protein n=1 Tax=Krasilnikovia sp. M28-CT-15 TaxID=3373540 RepID=UPI003876B6E6
MSTASTEPLSQRVGRTLRAGPAQTLRTARRQVNSAVQTRARRAWSGLALRMARMAAGTVAQTTFVGVLDGHTLNLQAVLPGLDAAPSSVEVQFRKDGTVHTAALTLSQDPDDGRWLVEGTIVLGDRPGAVRLDGGVWQLGVQVTLASGQSRRLTLRRLTAAPPGRRGPTMLVPPCPDTGTRYRPTTSAFGVWQLTVRPGRPRAEVVRLAVELGGTEIVGRFVGVADSSDAVAEFTRRADGATHLAAVDITGQLFRITAPLAAMVPAAGGKEIWDVRIRIADRHHLRVGRCLHDLTNLGRVLRTYERRILLPSGPVFHLRPYYTSAGSLALACTSADQGVAA